MATTPTVHYCSNHEFHAERAETAPATMTVRFVETDALTYSCEDCAWLVFEEWWHDPAGNWSRGLEVRRLP